MYGATDMFGADPQEYFDSAAGPLVSDVVGPPLDVLDTYTDGSPLAAAQESVASGVGGGMHKHFWTRGDVQAFAIMVAGAALIHVYLRSE